MVGLATCMVPRGCNFMTLRELDPLKVAFDFDKNLGKFYNKKFYFDRLKNWKLIILINVKNVMKY